MSWQVHLQDGDISVRPLQLSDKIAAFHAASDPLIWAQHPDPSRYTEEGFNRYFAKVMATVAPLAIVKDHKIIGVTTYYDPSPLAVWIGYTFLSRAHWGGQTNQRVKKILLDHAFTLVDEVHFHIGAQNIRSQTAVARLGAKKVREDDHWADGVNYPHFCFSITKQEWAILDKNTRNY